MSSFCLNSCVKICIGVTSDKIAKENNYLRKRFVLKLFSVAFIFEKFNNLSFYISKNCTDFPRF